MYMYIYLSGFRERIINNSRYDKEKENLTGTWTIVGKLKDRIGAEGGLMLKFCFKVTLHRCHQWWVKSAAIAVTAAIATAASPHESGTKKGK